MKDSNRPLGDWVAAIALIQSAALLCGIVWQTLQVAWYKESLTYLLEHCRMVP